MDQLTIKTRSQPTSPSTGASHLVIAVESPKSVTTSSAAPSPVLSLSSSQSRSPQTTTTVSTSLLASQLQYTDLDRFSSESGRTRALSAGMDIKANKVDTLHTQKGKKLVRRNASDKLKLIQMVHDNPILWDSRLPNFKGAEEEKNRAWEHIGKEFNAPGRRVARAFKSLRESYRRELAHVKIMGNGFKPKWTLYEPMNFLRDVIRERKGGSHAAEQAALGLNLSAFSQHLNGSNNNTKSSLKLGAGLHHSSFNESALNLSKCGSLNLSHEDFYYFVKPELELAAQNNSIIGAGGIVQPLPAHMQNHASNQSQQPQLQQTQGLQNVSHDSRVTSTRNDNNSSSTPQNATFDDLDGSSVRSADEASMRNAPLSHQGSDEVEELDAIDADFPYPLILDNSSRASGSAVGAGGSASKRRRKDLTDAGEMSMDGGDDDDDYEGQMLQQHRQMRQQSGGLISGGLPFGISMLPPPQTMREVLNSQFCGFISAKLNSMEDSDADNLMNKILMLLVQTQGNTETQNIKK